MLRIEYLKASVALELAMRRGSQAEFEAALAWKQELIERLCRGEK